MKRLANPILVPLVALLLVSCLGTELAAQAAAPGGTQKPAVQSPANKPPLKSPAVIAAPAAPGGLQAVAGAAKVDLTWQDNSAGAAGFKIERRESGGAYGEIAVVGPGATKYADTAVKPGTAYTYRVRAVAGAALSAYSNEAAATVPAQTAPVQLTTGQLVFIGKAAGITTGQLVFTGRAGAEITTGQLVFIGKADEITTGQLVFTGRAGAEITTGQLVFTGKATEITTGQLVFTGQY